MGLFKACIWEFFFPKEYSTLIEVLGKMEIFKGVAQSEELYTELSVSPTLTQLVARRTLCLACGTAGAEPAASPPLCHSSV